MKSDRDNFGHASGSLFLHLLVIAISSLIVSCGTVHRTQSIAPGTPRYSIVHLEGRITSIPADSRWPSWVKVGVPYEYWAIIDNHAPDTWPLSSTRGHFEQKSEPTRYWLSLGSLRFNSESFGKDGQFLAAIVNDLNESNPDGYQIFSEGSHTWVRIPELPGLLLNGVEVSIKNKGSDRITSDQFPIRAFPLSERADWVHSPVIIGATRDRIRNQSLYGNLERFEVFQVSSEEGLARFGPFE